MSAVCLLYPACRNKTSRAFELNDTAGVTRGLARAGQWLCRAALGHQQRSTSVEKKTKRQLTSTFQRTASTPRAAVHAKMLRVLPCVRMYSVMYMWVSAGVSAHACMVRCV